MSRCRLRALNMRTGDNSRGEIIFYAAPGGAARVEVFFEDETF